MPALIALHDTEAIPDATSVPGVIGLHKSPRGITSLNVIVPENWFSAFRVIVEFDAEFTLVGPVELAVKVKSCTM